MKRKVIQTKVTLFERVAAILDEARKNVVRSVNNNMVIAYWLIGQEIIKEIQEGKDRASYGEQIIESLSESLNSKYGRGFSTTNLRYFRIFYSVYADRIPEIRHLGSGELKRASQYANKNGVEKDLNASLKLIESALGFSPNLGWTHYRELMHVENKNERLFYEIEAEKEGWDVDHLKRQIHTFLFARLLKSRNKKSVMELARKGHQISEPQDAIKNPYILDFLGLPDRDVYHESHIEQAIIDNIQQFLLELGKGFAFVGRQKRMQFDGDYFYADLVFYNCILKCYLLIDLKIGELTHQDVGQMDSYIRMFDDKYITEGDNPTIGLILCAKENETIARYSVLKGSKNLFASKYMLYLPTEKELVKELKREQKLIGSLHEKTLQTSKKYKASRKENVMSAGSKVRKKKNEKI
jgi:predicted nuclease of restriction endonuclease-like (RecB) superfamily